jgi:hypothetical protein
MLTFFSLPNEESADERGAKLKALQDYFHTGEPLAFRLLGDRSLSTLNKDRGDILVVNAHGNANVFAGFDADQFLGALESKGFGANSFSAIYLMACSVGIQAQDNSIYDNFAKDLQRAMSGRNISVKLYAPRGVLNYKVHKETKLGQSFYVVDEMYISSPERNYSLKEGLLLVHL